MLRFAVLFSVVCVCTAVGVPAQGQEWRQFRGPGARGVAENANLPDTWSETENVAWSREIAGRGWSSPIVTGGRVFLTTVVRDEGEPEAAKPGLYFGGNRLEPPDVPHAWRAVCLDLASGKPLWEKTLHRGAPETPRHIKNSYASETPVTDGEHVYVLFGDVGLFCLTLEGEQVWQRDMPPVKTRFGWGTAASPVLHQGRIYVVSDNEDASYLLALDAATGKEIWKVDRDEKSNWATPYVWRNEQRTEIITPGTGKTRAYDLDGQLLYELGGASSITIATPYTAHGLLYVSSGYVLDRQKPIFAIRPGAEGDISLQDDETTNESIAWSQPAAAPYNPSTLVYGDSLFVLYDRGFYAVFDAKTGEPQVELTRIPGGRSFTASPWAYGGKVFCLNEFGETFVFDAADNFKPLPTNKLPADEMYMSTPAIAGDRLLVRSSKRLYCLADSP
ncbi:MAG: PQQ-binding-like beta-propeller repeat protein [Pirellulaceae bacterium]